MRKVLFVATVIEIKWVIVRLMGVRSIGESIYGIYYVNMFACVHICLALIPDSTPCSYVLLLPFGKYTSTNGGRSCLLLQ